jgi:hypothetical protein
MAHNITLQQLENEVANSISKGLNFCYESNFNATPLHWPKIFKEQGYQIRMIYFFAEIHIIIVKSNEFSYE